MDPVTVYGETDVVKWMIRSAAYGLVAKDQREQAERNKPKK